MIIGRGFNGWHAKFLEHGCEVSSSRGTLEEYLSMAQDGTPIYDAENANQKEFIDWVYSGPMVSLTLQPNQVDNGTKDKVTTLFGLMPSGDKVVTSDTINGFTFIGVDAFMSLMKEKVSGIKTGKVIGGQILWD